MPRNLRLPLASPLPLLLVLFLFPFPFFVYFLPDKRSTQEEPNRSQRINSRMTHSSRKPTHSDKRRIGPKSLETRAKSMEANRL